VNHRKWEAWLAVSRKIETGGRNADVVAGAGDTPQPHHEAFVRRLIEYLPPMTLLGVPAKVLAPGCMEEALLLARAGYEVHALLLGPDNVRWLADKAASIPGPGKVVAREVDAHDLDYPAAFFDGYFSSQFHEHLLSWVAHLGEVRYCSKPGAIAFVDACGVLEPAFRIVWHTNLVPEQQVYEQWDFWGWAELWRGDRGDSQPQFVFKMLPMGAPAFKYSGYLSWAMRLRAGEKVRYDYHCPECAK
jgi:hypothetical protein